MVDQRYPRRLRLRKRPDFLRVQRRGRRVKAQHLVACWTASTTDRSPDRSARFGLTVSRKVGPAVVRNRVKRWLREAIRRHPRRPTQHDVVFIALPSAATAGLRRLQADVDRAFDRIGARS